jgi:copper chaperone CopZ
MTQHFSRTYTVHGMTCEHCRSAVSAAIAQINRVESVDVDLATMPRPSTTPSTPLTRLLRSQPEPRWAGASDRDQSTDRRPPERRRPAPSGMRQSRIGERLSPMTTSRRCVSMQ